MGISGFQLPGKNWKVNGRLCFDCYHELDIDPDLMEVREAKSKKEQKLVCNTCNKNIGEIDLLDEKLCLSCFNSKYDKMVAMDKPGVGGGSTLYVGGHKAYTERAGKLYLSKKYLFFVASNWSQKKNENGDFIKVSPS